MRSKNVIHLTLNLSALEFSICLFFSFIYFLQLLWISLVRLISPYSAQILLENSLFLSQDARLKNRLFCFEILPAEFVQASLSARRCVLLLISPLIG